MNLVIVSYHYPPSRVANARRPALLARAMLARGHSVQVVTRALAPAGVAAMKMNPPEDTALRIIRLPDPVDSWRLRCGRTWLADRVIQRLWPDDSMPWTIRAARHLRTEERGRSIVACIHPVSSLLLPARLQEQRPRFVFDYQESVSPFRGTVQFDHRLHRLLSRRLIRLEKSALRRAQSVVFSSLANRSAYADHGFVDLRRTVHIPHFCDANPYATSDLACDRQMIITYVGCFTRDRSPESFFRALLRFLDVHREAADRVRVQVYGAGLGPYKRMCEELDLQRIVQEMGSRDYDELLPILAHSHMLLLVAAPRHKLFFPSKCAEYVAARRPIISITAPGSEVDEVLDACGRNQWGSCYGDVNAISAKLNEAWQMFIDGRLGRVLPAALTSTEREFATAWESVLDDGVLEADGGKTE